MDLSTRIRNLGTQYPTENLSDKTGTPHILRPCRITPFLNLSLQHDHTFDVLGVGEHIDRLDAAELVAAGEEHVEVAALGVDIAGDIDDAFWRAFEQRGEKALIAPGAGRIHENNVGLHLVRGHLLHVLTRVADGEPAVFDAIQAGVRYRVVHRVAVYLDADDLLCLIRGAEADGADAAVGIEYSLISG